MSDTASVYSIGRGTPVTRRLAGAWPLIGCALLGMGLLYVVGFAGPERIHNAAHDARHSQNFPCH